jgi:hypothetical protein
MIYKNYRPNGTPDLRRWIMECDGCRLQQPMLSVTAPQWLVSLQPGMAVYCPDCLIYQSACLVCVAIRCPACGSCNLDFWDTRQGLYAGCCDCGTYTVSYDEETHTIGLVDGWRFL